VQDTFHTKNVRVNWQIMGKFHVMFLIFPADRGMQPLAIEKRNGGFALPSTLTK